ncbi:MAG: S8 family serine peptidase [Saprospiraceae bacterium]|nr:S8 family serine peptidase [Saprospiraceae bacterium]
MHKFLCFISLFFFLGKGSLLGQETSFLKKQKLDNFIKTHLQETQQTFNWSIQSDTIIMSGLLNSDSILVIGFSPPSMKSRSLFFDQNFNSDAWNKARREVKQLVDDYYNISNIEVNKYPLGINSNRPYFCVKVYDYNLLHSIRQLNTVRYTDVMTFVLGQSFLKSDSGCSPVTIPIEPADTVGVSPEAVISWHNINHNTQDGWNKSNKGQGVNIAILDTGLSPTQSKLNADFDEGESFGRTVTKKGFFAPTIGGPYDGWEDQCGHGTSMAGLAVGPKGFNNTPAGVAYKANLISYRCTEDVIINTTQEKDGVSDALFHAADTTVHIISMSLGDLFFNGMVADAIAYAEGNGKLIFAAAGTSTFITNGFGVIFPADMNETVAVTGVKEGSAPYERCETCHDGPEVDFVVEMERVSNTSLHGVTLGEPDLSITYVGGSSCATATTAGQAALILSNDLSMNSAQIVAKMMAASNFFPNRDDDHGWGTVDLDLALSQPPFESCDDSLNYTITMEITNISFPPTSDGIFNNTAEWVVEIEGQSFFFEVDIAGESDSPNEFLNNSTCGFYPMVIQLGSNLCGENFIDNINVITHEDDGGSNDCTYNSTFDDDYSSTNETILFSNNTFAHQGGGGVFTFTYNLYCKANERPELEVSGDDMLCVNGTDGTIDATATGGVPSFTITYNINNGGDQTLVSDNTGLAQLVHSPISQGNFSYLFSQVESAEGCISKINETHSLYVSPVDYAQGGYGALTGTINSIKDYETDGVIDAFQVLDSLAIVDYDSGIEINLLAGFEIKQGALFYAFINGCNNGNGGLNIIDSDSNEKR